MKAIVSVLALCMMLAAWPASADFATASAAIKKGDFETARQEFTPLAEQGNARAQYNVALMHDHGLGTEVSYLEAADWYRKAAEQGLADAQHNLAVIYAGGKELPQDLVQALFWFDLAAISGMDTAKRNRDVVSSNMTSSQIAEASRLTQEWLAEHPGE